MLSDKIAKDRMTIFRELQSKLLYLNCEAEEWESWQTASDEYVINCALLRAINCISDELKVSEANLGAERR